MVSAAAGRAMRMLARNLSDMRQPWVLVAMMVVSEMKERLSPNRLPPTTTAVAMWILDEVVLAIPTAMGTKAAMVPQLVPMLSDTRQEAMNRPTRMKLPGSTDNVRFTTLSTHPISLAMEENAPARMNMRSMSMMPPLSSVLRGGAVCLSVYIFYACYVLAIDDVAVLVHKFLQALLVSAHGAETHPHA